MPARQFFAMFSAASQIRAFESLNQCQIAAIPNCNPKYFDELKTYYYNQIRVKPTRRKEKVNGLAGRDAHHALQNIFMSKKGRV